MNFSLRVACYKQFVSNYREITNKSTFIRIPGKPCGGEG